MAFDRAALEALAESVGDGAPIEWAAIEAQASDEQRGVIRQLRVLEGLAHLHRTLPAVDDGAARQFDRSSAAPAIGNWGHLTLLERLGGGTFGEVYRAWDAQLEREVALKVMRGDAPDASRLVAEGRLLAKVRHEHVVTVYGVATHDNRVGMWM
ncbi:MAG TPA: protein kinase, partial [Casimicrobiaceae bacterium]